MKKFWSRAFSGRMLGAIIFAAVFGLSLPAPAHADFSIMDPALQFAVLGQFSSNATNFNNGNIVGDVGIGTPRQFTISNANLTGNVRFSGSASTSGFTGGACPNNVSGGGCFTGSIIGNDPIVTAALNASNSASQTYGGQAGTSVAITSGGSLNASAGILNSGNRVFTVSSVNFPNGTFTINGSASDYVILNVGSNANFHGQILLAGGISDDHLLINMTGGNYTTHTGGHTLDVNTNGLETHGIWLDPNGTMSASHTVILGRFIGGDTSNQQIVSGFNITAPTTITITSIPTPETASFMSLGLGLFAMVLYRSQRKKKD